MQTLVEIAGLQLAAQVDGVQPAEGGILLIGSRVALLHPFGNTKFYRNGFQSWSLSSWLDLQHPPLQPPSLDFLWPQTDHPALLQRYPYASSGLGALQDPAGDPRNILLLGALDLGAQVKVDHQVLKGAYESSDHFTKAANPPAGSSSAGSHSQAVPEWFLAYGEEQAVFARYADLLGERLGRRGQGPSPRVWCSWYSLYSQIDEQVLYSVLQDLSGLPFDVFQIDDGWQLNIGDWEPNPKFPAGMGSLATRIKQAGFTPGLWLAPLVVQPASSIFQDHPEWLLHDRDGGLLLAGRNWGSDFYALDLTQPAVKDWLSALIQKVRAWGFDYLKLDFLYAAALPAIRQQDVPGELAFRAGMEVVREAAGGAYVLACGAPILASLGLADGLRIGPDVAPYWDNRDRSVHLHDLAGPSTLNALRTSLHRLWLRPLIQVDPDVAFFRARFNLLKPQEMSFLQDLALITGFRATSDLPSWLDPSERQALGAFLEQESVIERLGRYRFRINGRDIDYGFVELL